MAAADLLLTLKSMYAEVLSMFQTLLLGRDKVLQQVFNHTAAPLPAEEEMLCEMEASTNPGAHLLLQTGCCECYYVVQGRM